MLGDKYYDGKIHILTDPFGKLKGYTIELHDNTEHYKTLALKERYNDELEKEVEEKTSRIKTIQEKLYLVWHRWWNRGILAQVVILRELVML